MKPTDPGPCLILRDPADQTTRPVVQRWEMPVPKIMPVISRFCGVVVRMLFAPVLGAHFHATRGDHELVIAIRPLRVIQGDAPQQMRELVLRWAARHQRELLAAWQACACGSRPRAIAPLP